VADNLDTATVPGREGQPIAYEVNFGVQAGRQAKPASTVCCRARSPAPY